ncbi:TRAP transporter small permease subunit [Aestuariispira ectoiniformans]|uniref:TRAP transporter small permease subunit n=1 Tax=Aestuariispira ectoiniformans TaxID=2775080 RepID=UPI00223BC7E5|nr:TRAP transporter small permease subunit [Aestuariispira ectoiniformans]
MKALACLARAIDRLNQTIGMSVAWLALFMVIVQFLVVVLRYVFGYGSIFMQESIIYMHGFLFLLGAGYTLLHGGHVRVDIFYREASPRKKAMVDIFGVFALLGPVCIGMMVYTWSYVANSWEILETSKETSGIPAIFVLKSAMIAFLVLILLQGLSMAIHSLRVLTGQEQPPADEEHEGL